MEFLKKSKEELEEDEEEEEENPIHVCDFFPNSHSQNHQEWLEQPPTQNHFQNQQPLMDLSLRMDLNNNGPVAVAVEREHMFDKVVTPSDVGKLNRLVIPKQHAEKYFPLDSTTNEKGLILNFEDRNGKPWRFRYSYWNSSQSYVMTKGWSRFVKDKKLDAGDVVSFHRGVGESANDRLFIDWCRRRPDVARPHPLLLLPQSLRWASAGRHFTSVTPPLLQPIRTRHHLGNYSNLYPNYAFEMSNFRPSISSPSSSSLYRLGNGVVVNNEGSSMGVERESSGGTMVAATAAKRLRLFGVNMECAATHGEHQRGEQDLLNDGVSRRGKEPFSLNWDLL